MRLPIGKNLSSILSSNTDGIVSVDIEKCASVPVANIEISFGEKQFHTTLEEENLDKNLI